MSYCGADKEPDWRNTSVIMTLDTPLFKKWSNGIPFKQQKLVISKTSHDILLFSACSDIVYFLSGGFSEKVLLFLWVRFSSCKIRTQYSWLGRTNATTVLYILSPRMPWLGYIKWLIRRMPKPLQSPSMIGHYLHFSTNFASSNEMEPLTANLSMDQCFHRCSWMFTHCSVRSIVNINKQEM